MRNGYRPAGRFFCLLMMVAAGACLATGLMAQTNGPAMTQVTDTVYRADGATAKGTVLISWPAFTTADGKAVAAGSLSVQLGNSGSFTAALAPNTGAQPAGVYYKVVYQLAGQEPSSEYWVVPATGSTTIGSVRAKLQPATVAAQALTRDVADSSYVHVSGNSTVNGVVSFTASPNVPTPQNAGDVANKAYVDANAGSGNLASPPAIGNVTPNAATFTTVNKVINPTAYAGGDIGAQINTAIAANTCAYGKAACIVELPSGIYSYATTITLPFGTTLQCSGKTSDFIKGTLNYTGNGTAIAITGASAALRNCGINAPNASTVVDNSGQAAVVDSVYFVGAQNNFSSGTTLIRAHANKQSYSNIWAEGFSGIGFQCDHAIDTVVDGVNFYGLGGNSTGITLLVETGCAGLHVNKFAGGSSGLHGLVVRNTLGGQNPIQLFFDDFVSDCTYSDGWYFDPSLYGNELDAHFVNSWAAGAGVNCSNGATLQAHKAGVRISGGSAINISNSKIRANSGSGVVIDNSTGYNSSGIVIGDNQFLSNNKNNDGTESGIDVTQVVNGLSIHDNTITNSLEGGTGAQKYGINISSSSTGVNVKGNNITGNAVGRTNYASGVVFEPEMVGGLTATSATFTQVNNEIQADSYTSLAAAVAAAGTGPATIKLNCGLGNAVKYYPVSAPIAVPGTGIWIKGAGNFCAKIQVNHTGDMFTVGYALFHLSDVGIVVNTASSRSGASLFNFTSSSPNQAILERIRFEGNYSSANNGRIVNLVSGDGLVSMKDWNIVGGNLVWESALYADSDGTHGSIEGLTMDNVHGSPKFSKAGIYLNSYIDTAHFLNMGFEPNYTGSGPLVWLQNTHSITAPRYIYFEQFGFSDASTSTASPLIQLDAGRNIVFDTGQIGGNGVCFQSGSGVDNFTLVNNHFNGCGSQAIIMQSFNAAGTWISNNEFDDSCYNNVALGGTCDTIDINPPAGNFHIVNNHWRAFSHALPNGPRYGIYDTGSIGNNSTILGNVVPSSTVTTAGASIGSYGNSRVFANVGIADAAGSTALNSLGAANGDADIQQSAYQIIWRWTGLPNNRVGLALEESTANTCSNCSILYANTMQGSTANTVGFYSGGTTNGVVMDPTANLHPVNGGKITANAITGTPDAVLNNLTVNGTCTGCGSGSANLSAPPPIGNTTPNTASFTQVNNIILADVAAGADACAKISAAVSGAAATGQTIDARGFTGTQACASTLTISKPVTILFGDATFTLNGNPGINITATHAVTLRGAGWDYPGQGQGLHGTIFKSGAAYPLLTDTGVAAGTILSDIEFNGNSVGTFGAFMPQTGSSKFSRLYIHNFAYAGIIAGGTLNHFEGLYVTANGGDGIIAAADCVMDGNTGIYGNGATGLQVVSGGCRISKPNIADNGLHNVWINGSALATSRANSTQIVQPILLRPATGNAGNYIYYAANVGGTTGSSAPSTWCQTQGCQVSDGTVTWVNLNTLGGVTVPLTSATLLSDLYVGDAGNATASTYPGFQASNIRIDGWAGHTTCDSLHIMGLHIQQGYFLQANTDGLHIKNCQNVSVSNAYIGGESYNPAVATPDRGGLVLEGVATSVFSDLTLEYQARSAVQVTNASSYNQFMNVHVNSDTGNTVTGTSAYGVYVDTASSAGNTFTNLYIAGRATNSKGVSMPTGVGNFIHNYVASGTNSGVLSFDSLGSAVATNVVGRDATYPVEFDIGNNQRALLIDNAGNTTVQNLTVTGTCTGCGLSSNGYGYLVSRYASIQAAIDAAYNNGTVLGQVIDDRTAPYSGTGFIVRDSVTLKLAATTYTITSPVTYNNGIATVTAGIISMPGSHLVGAGTSPNHGTNVNAGAGLNADVIATSTVGTGTGGNAQWWHWGSIENFHMDGNKSGQTAGNCINVENMGETAVLRALELGNCYASDLKLEGNFATQSEITNVTVNSAGQYGINLDNFQGVGVLRGLSGDSNATSIIRFNGNQSATLTVLGLKSEEEVSGHDPLITVDMPTDGSQPSLYIVGGYTYARAGVKDVIKIINGKSGAAPFINVNSFYVDSNFVNAVNDTVNSRTFAATNMNKVPFSYLPTGSYQSGQAFTFAPGTYIQGGLSALTEIFGSNTDGSSMIAAQGNGDGTSYFTGGLKIGIPNRTQFGQPPEMMARMGSRFLGVGQGYDTNTWVFVPIWKTGDSSNRWIGEPNQRWPEVYATDVNATTATVGTLNVTNCVGCGGSGPLYSIAQAGISMATSNNVTITSLAGTGCSSGVCTMATPTTDGTYRFAFQLIETAAGSGGTCGSGAAVVRLWYTDPDTGVAYVNSVLNRAANGTSAAVNMYMSNAAPSATNNFVGIPQEFRVKGGVPIKVDIFQGSATTCTTPPVFTFRGALYGPLGY